MQPVVANAKRPFGNAATPPGGDGSGERESPETGMNAALWNRQAKPPPDSEAIADPPSGVGSGSMKANDGEMSTPRVKLCTVEPLGSVAVKLIG